MMVMCKLFTLLVSLRILKAYPSVWKNNAYDQHLPEQLSPNITLDAMIPKVKFPRTLGTSLPSKQLRICFKALFLAGASSTNCDGDDGTSGNNKAWSNCCRI
mmetsp:Transcript_8987/g.13024  ORF Transcript_8987/g.13024 Transcript_8987/m.13024 type:complete len:102 (+) Transcript_8987:641-946(+)